MQALGILGGTFDPIHYGHLRPADEVRRRLGLSQVRLVPAGQPPHRLAPQASAADRLRMVELAVAEFPGLVADARELARPGPSYTVDTLRSLRAELGERPLCLLMGTDAFLDIQSWHEWQQLPELAHLLVVQRPGFSLGVWPAWAQGRRAAGASVLHERPAGHVYAMDVTPVDASATQVRQALRAGTPVTGSVPAVVIDYIQTHHLYLA